MKSLLVTGSAGLIGSEVCRHSAALGYQIHGVDNNQRRALFGSEGDTLQSMRALEREIPYRHYHVDIRDRGNVSTLIEEICPDAIVHAAAQPSHDLSAKIPVDDFAINAVGTVNLLDAARRFCPESPFVFLSTNKVYGDGPNRIHLREDETRWSVAAWDEYASGIPETFPLDRCTHSPFGASKAAADLMVQEYGRYFGMPTVCLRGGCLTGSNHAGVELHGFLSYLVKCNAQEREYTVYGYKGKQVRDNIHAADVAAFIAEYIAAPRRGEVYNIGGGRENSCSILEAFDLARQFTGKSQIYSYVDTPRVGDHVCYYTDLRKAREHYPRWRITRSLSSIFEEIAERWMAVESAV